MTARWLQQKRRKMRRSYLKRYSSSVVNSGSSHVDRDKSNPHTLGARGQAIGGSYQGKPLALHEIPKTISPFDKPWQSSRQFHGIDGYHHIVLAKSKLGVLKFFFSGLEFFFIKEDFKTQRCLRSIIYSSRDEAMNAWGRKKVLYVENVASRTPDS